MNTRPVRILFAALCLYACYVLLVIPGSAGACDWGGDYPYAGLTYEVMDAETLPVTVQFNSTSRSPPGQQFTSWHWDFGDGMTSTVWYNHRSVEAIHPRHTFSTYQDHFDVCLKVTTQCDKSNEACERVQAYCTKPKAGFTVDVTEGPAPLKVSVTDTSEHTPGSATTWVYRKDAGAISSQRDFSGTFTTPGVYTLTQTVKKDCNPGSDSFSRQIRVTPAVVQGYVLNISIPTTTPTIGILGVYFTISNTTSPATTMTTVRAAAATTTAAAPVTATATTTREPVAAAAAGTVQGTPAPGTGSLRIVTEPAGAEVYVDDVLWGGSPVEIPGLSAGVHTLRIVRKGYQTMTVPVTVFAGGSSDYLTALVPEDGSPGMLPLITGAVVILALAGAGAFLYIKKKKGP